MALDLVYISRSGDSPSGKDWEAFLKQQATILAERSGDGWDLVTAIDVVAPASMREASRTSGVLLYFRRP